MTWLPDVLALIPARCGSKSIKNKNVRLFRGKPLLAHSVLQALEAQTVQRVVVSTDSTEYAELARAYGADVPFIRPAEIAGDLSTDLEVFQHALRWLDEHEGYWPQICVHLRPTYPTRNVADIDGAVRLLLERDDADSVRSVATSPLSPYKMWQMEQDGILHPILDHHDGDAYNLPRQCLPVVHMQNAAVDVVRTDVIVQRHSMTGKRIVGYEMSSFDDIDDWIDFERAHNDFFGSSELPRDKRLVFDLDGVLAKLVSDNSYELSQPDAEMIDIVNRLYDVGNYIIIHTARGVTTGIDWRSTTERQLRDWGVRYHELYFNKPAADFYIDDRSLSIFRVRSWSTIAR